MNGNMDGDVDSSTTFVISDALEQIVTHYSQSIHEVEERPPYFDSLLGYPPKVPPVVKFLLDRLIHLSSGSILEWVQGYVTAIRPLLLQTSVGCVPVLQNYELVLSQWLSRIISSSEEVSSATSIEDISRTIEVLSSDITLFSSSSHISFPPYARCNIVLPSLLRMLHQIFTVVSISNAKAEFSKGSSCVTRCVVSLLAFDTIRIDPTTVAPSLVRVRVRVRVDNDLLETICSCPPINPEHNSTINNLLSLESVDWTSVTSDATSWNDPVTGIGSRAAKVVWTKVASLVLLCEGDTRTAGESFRNQSLSNHLPDPSKEVGNERKEMQRDILRSLGMARMARAVRSHFFGHDMLLWEAEKRTSTQVIMGRRVTKKQPAVDEKSYQSVPSRINVALSFVRYLGQEDIPSTRDLLVDILPMCFELIDASSPVLIALGGSALIHLLDHLDPSSDCWNEYAENALAVLDRAFTSCREGPVLVILGQAQSRLLRIIRNGEKKRRQVTRQWLSVLRQSSTRPASQMICWELLIGGVIPLLYQHAELPNADAIEMGRLGLAALLPLTDGDFVDSKTQAASLVALTNLMIGAHPIMPRHGGKIMSHLLASAAFLMVDDNKEKVGLREFALHTAAVGSAICGPGFAGEVAHNILHDKDNFQDTLIQLVIKVREYAGDLIAKDSLSAYDS